MIGEESAAAGRIPDPGAHFFSVDPLDGTRDFVAGGDEFTVNIGWIEYGLPVSGVVLSPVGGELYLGEPGRALRGVYDMKTGDMREPLRPISASVQRPAQGWRVVTSRHSGKNSKTNNFMAALGGATPAYASSSIKFCRLAEGKADLYPRFGSVNEWDVAAGHAVLAAAGGDVMHLNGEALRYGARNGVFEVRGLIAYANREAEKAAREALAAMDEV
jgi:3'(2'),5'-bisphosphate nucleotidase